MADEKKTYLINIESNLNKYAEDAVQAKKRVDELKASNEQLKNSGTATAAEIEASNAALRNAQTEYKKATKLVDLQTQANNSNANSRKQLEAIVKIEQQRLGSLANTITVNSKGQRVLTEEYKKQVRALADAKGAVIAYDLAQKDGRSNIGRYGESVAQSFKSMGAGMLATIGPAALLAVGLKKLKEAFLQTEDGAKVHTWVTQITKTIFQNAITKTKEYWKAVFAGNAQAAKEIQKDIFKNLAATDTLAKKKDEIRKGDRNDLVKIAELETEIEMLALSAADATKSESEQKRILIDLQKKENELIDYKKADLEEDLKWVKDGLDIRAEDTDLLDEQARITAEIVKLEGERSLRVEKRLSGLRQKELDRLEKEKADSEKTSKEFQDKQVASQEKARSEREKAGVAEMERLADSYNQKRELEQIDIEAGFEYQRLKNEGNLGALNTLLDQEYAALLTSVDYNQLTNNEKLLAEEQYNQAKKALSDERVNQQIMEIDAIASLAGSLSDLFGKQTIAAKFLSISQALISTYTAGVKAMAELPLGAGPVLRFATLAGVIAAGMAQVKNILAVKVPGGDSGGSAPTSISSLPTAQRITATQTGSTVLNQPNLTQTQLNALPQQGQMTVEQLIEAFKQLPPQELIIEKLEAQSKSKRKVEIRANI